MCPPQGQDLRAEGWDHRHLLPTPGSSDAHLSRLRGPWDGWAMPPGAPRTTTTSAAQAGKGQPASAEAPEEGGPEEDGRGRAPCSARVQLKSIGA